MLFITEEKLREEYKKSPFDSYLLKKNNKLTPQAKQFLTDFRIEIINEKNIKPKKTKKKNKTCLDENNIKKALIIKELALDIREFDSDLAMRLNKYAKRIYKGEDLDLKKLDTNKEKAIEIYINMDLISPYLRAFTSINKAYENLKEIDEDLGEILLNNLYGWFIKINEGGESY